MRSPQQYIITKDEVHGYANHWLGTSLQLEYKGTKCTASTLLQILLIAASRTVSIFAACRDLADAPRVPASVAARSCFMWCGKFALRRERFEKCTARGSASRPVIDK